jgi:hypothetical protein
MMVNYSEVRSVTENQNPPPSRIQREKGGHPTGTLGNP